MTEHIRVIPDKCRACRRCEVACIAAHHDLSFKDAMKRRDEFVPRVQVVKAEGLKTTVRCHQCQPAPCCNICPAGALQQDEEGRILMNEELCIACRMCIQVCPYGAISMDETAAAPDEALPACQSGAREIAVRCDMCYKWRKAGGKEITACMEACPVQALVMVMPDGKVIEAPKPVKKKAEA